MKMEDAARRRGRISGEGELGRLINVLRAQGIDKGRQEADGIIADAKKEKARIVSEGRAEAERIIEHAEAKASSTMKNMEKQLDLAIRDFLLGAKGKLEELVALRPLRDAAGKALSDPLFIKNLIHEMVMAFVRARLQEVPRLHISIPEEMKEQFVREWVAMMRKDLTMSPTLHTEEALKGFKLSVEGEGGELVVDADSVIDVLKPFVSDRFHSILDKQKLPRK